MNALPLFTGPFAQAVGWALLHLVWQATIVAGILLAVLALMPAKNSNARYVASCSALALVFVAFVATAFRAYDPAVAPIVATASAAAPEIVSIPLSQLPAIIAEGAASGMRDRAIAALTTARNAFPLIVALWLAGVALLSTRLLVSWLRARKLIRVSAAPASREWQRLAARLSAALGLRRVVRVLQTSAVDVPSVIGSLRPVILIPASALTGMTPEQIEMVLAHELAHIRRHDFLVNLLQAVVETLMFYHPAVWWMSSRVRIERENCCDDLAMTVCGSPVQYARALTRLEELRASAPGIMVAANGGSLLDRIRRIASDRSEGTATTSRWAAAVAMLSIVLLAVVVPSLPALAQKDESPKTTESYASVDVSEPALAAERSANDADDADDEDGLMDVDVDSDIDVDIDTDIDPDIDDNDEDIDIDIDSGYENWTPEAPDVDVDMPDFDFDFDYDEMTPRPVAVVAPAPPVRAAWPVPAVAPVPRVAATPRAALAPLAPMAPVLAGRWGDDDEENDRELGSGGKLTVDELISLRAHGVTHQYVNTMREIFPGLTLRGVTSMAAVEVTPEFVREMRAAGLDLKTAREATSLRAVGVTPDYIKQMKSAGLDAPSLRDVTSLRAVGVTPDFIRQMRAAGFEVKSARDATSLRAVDVTPSFIEEMRKAGFEIKTVRDATSLRAVGVTPQWVSALRDAGVRIETAREATSLRAVGVSPEFVKRLAAAGYTNLTAKDLARLASAGVDEDFIRDMEQYRKK